MLFCFIKANKKNNERVRRLRCKKNTFGSNNVESFVISKWGPWKENKNGELRCINSLHLNGINIREGCLEIMVKRTDLFFSP